MGSAQRFLHSVPSTDDCVLWPFAISGTGYGALNVRGRTVSAHRFVCELRHGPAPAAGMHAAHSCGVRACVNPRHVRWATVVENQADRVTHGTTSRGERYGAAKLTEAAVRAIREAFAAGVPQKALAAEHGVSQVTISNVTTRTSWGWLD